jgi:RNA polymerase sigma-70 factor (ECF subfamily)
MITDMDTFELVRGAQLGDRKSMDALAEAARHRVFAYVYRLTLNHDLAQDLLQETLLKMVESIKELRQPERFWSWLFRTALGNVQHYYRDQTRAGAVEFSELSRQRLSEYVAADRDDGLNRAMRRELAQTIVAALARLKVSYRHVLALRCYEQLSFAEIAEVMDCKELRARVLFFRAKRALHRQLTRGGYSKELLLTGLGLFGVLTGPADSVSAAGTVHATSLSVGLLATVVGAVGTRAGKALIAALTAATISITLDQIVYFVLFGSLALISFIIALCWE